MNFRLTTGSTTPYTLVVVFSFLFSSKYFLSSPFRFLFESIAYLEVYNLVSK